MDRACRSASACRPCWCPASPWAEPRASRLSLWERVGVRALNSDDYLSLAEDIVRRAKAHGADDADALVAAATEFEATVREGELERLMEAGSKALGLRVFVGG